MLAYLTKPADRLGDTIVLASIFAELMPRYPDLQIICNNGESVRWVARLFPNLVVATTPDEIPRPVDVLIHFGKPDLKTFRLAKRLRAKRFVAERRGMYRWLATDLVQRGLPRSLHQANIWGEYFRLAFPNLPTISSYVDVRPLVKPKLAARPYAVIHTDTGNSNRSPSFEVLSHAIEQCVARGLGILLTSAPDSHLAKRLSDSFPSAIRLHPSGIEELAAALAQAHLVVSPDTGPAHLAAALRVPVLALSCKVFLPSERWQPMVEQATVLRPKSGCASCLARGRCHRPPYPEDTCTLSFDLDELSRAIISVVDLPEREPARA